MQRPEGAGLSLLDGRNAIVDILKREAKKLLEE